jgi:hypothetical protein
LIHNFLPKQQEIQTKQPTKHTAFAALGPTLTKPKHKTLHYNKSSNNLPLIPTWYDFAFAVTDPETGEALEYKELLTHSNDEFRQQWQESAANEFGRLAQGIKGRVEYTDAIDFIHFHEKPKTKGYLWTRRLHCPTPEERTKPHPHHCRRQSH